MLVFGHFLVEFINVFPEILVATDFSCSVLEEHNESSRMEVSTWVCPLSRGRCRMSKFSLLVCFNLILIFKFAFITAGGRGFIPR